MSIKLTFTLATAPALEPNRLSEPAPNSEPPSQATTTSGSSPDDQGAQSGNHDNSPDTSQHSAGAVSADVGNLWSAIQSVASHVANSQGPIVTSPPGESPSVGQPASVPQQDSNADDAQTAQNTDSDRYTAAEPAVTGVTTTRPPVFTFQGNTLNPGGAATFGGSPVSELPGQDGVVIDGTQTVLVSDSQATTFEHSGLGPLTISRSGSALVFNGQTLSSGQLITAGQTTVSLGQSTGVLYVNGAATTLAGLSITIGGTVYTAATATPTTGGDFGGYIYSGIGGTATSETSSHGGSANGTGPPSFTGDGSRLHGWCPCGWVSAILALWLT
jgi:hypothetical protein